MKRLSGLLLLSMGIAGHMFAGTVVPEVDPSSGVAALALLSGGMLILRSRKKR
jgi:LPXTG-motif cell wall-anchored protein